MSNSSERATRAFARTGGGPWATKRRETYQVGEGGRVEAEGEEGGVCLHVYLGAAADGVKPPHRDVALVAEAEAHDVQHGAGGRRRRTERQPKGVSLAVYL